MLVKLGRGERLVLVVIVLGGGLIVASFLASAFGAVTVSVADIFRMALNKMAVFDFPATWRAVDETIIFQIKTTAGNG